MLFHIYILITCILFNAYALNKLVNLPLSITSRFDSKDFYHNPNVPFSFTNFSKSNNQEDLQELLASRNASFISYSIEFSSIIGSNPQLTLIGQQPISIEYAHEGGAYVPETNEIWFTANQLPIQNTNISSINLLTNQINLLDINPPIITPNGANYFQGYVYICSQGNKTIPAGIYAVNPTTYISRLIVNSWFGYRLNSPNDVTFSTKILNRNFMWFTDPHVAYYQGFANTPQRPNTVYRYDMLTSELRPIIIDINIPNGIAFNRNETVLYISETPLDINVRTVYAYDINKDGLPINRRIFSISSTGGPDGIRVDENNRVWIAEGDGINIRDEHGNLLGVILGHGLCSSGVISNFGLIDNTLIILGQENVWRLNLTTNVL